MQIFGQFMRSVARACQMTHHYNSAAERYGFSDPVVIGGVLWKPLTAFPQLLLLRKMMQEVMRVIGSDDVL